MYASARKLANPASSSKPAPSCRTRKPLCVRALKGEAASPVESQSAPSAAAGSAPVPTQILEGVGKTLEKFDMVTAPPGKRDMGSKIIDTIADAGVPMVLGVALLAVIADQWEKRSGKKSLTVRALFFDDPTQLSQDEDNVCQRVIYRLGTPAAGQKVADKGIDLFVYKRPESVLTYKEQLQLRQYLRDFVPAWRKQVEADEELKEDDLRALFLLDKTLMEAGKPEVERILKARALKEAMDKSN